MDEGLGVPAGIQPEAAVSSANSVSVVVASAALASWKFLQRSLSPKTGFALLSCTAVPDEVIETCRRLRPLVLVIDRAFLDFDGMDPAAFVALVGPTRSPRVLVRLDDSSPKIMEKLLRLGCDGFLEQHVAPSTLRRAVRAVASGELWVNRRLISTILLRAGIRVEEAENGCVALEKTLAAGERRDGVRLGALVAG